MTFTSSCSFVPAAVCSMIFMWQNMQFVIDQESNWLPKHSWQFFILAVSGFRAWPDADVDIHHICQSSDKCSLRLEWKACVSAWENESFGGAVSGGSREDEQLSSQTLGWEMPFQLAGGGGGFRIDIVTMTFCYSWRCLAFSCCTLFEFWFARLKFKVGAQGFVCSVSLHKLNISFKRCLSEDIDDIQYTKDIIWSWNNMHSID